MVKIFGQRIEPNLGFGEVLNFGCKLWILGKFSDFENILNFRIFLDFGGNFRFWGNYEVELKYVYKYMGNGN